VFISELKAGDVLLKKPKIEGWEKIIVKGLLGGFSRT